jgi:hypothetical protein
MMMMCYTSSFRFMHVCMCIGLYNDFFSSDMRVACSLQIILLDDSNRARQQGIEGC